LKKILAILLIISLSLTVLVISIELNSYNKSYYHKSYIKNNIPKETGKTMDELLEITDSIIEYLKYKGENELLEPYFNNKEILHMKDVQSLFDLARIIKIFGIIISLFIIIYFYKRQEYVFLGKTLSLGLFINHIVFILLFIVASVNFNKYFTYFHLIFFTNDLWILDPNTDLMIQMLPENFFMGIAARTVLSFIGILAIIQVIAYIYIRKEKTIYEKNTRKN